MCPAVDGVFPLHGAEFAADPHAAYARMRFAYGSLVPVELHPGVPATLVIGYRAALRILNDPVGFPADPRGWQSTVPADCPILPMIEWRPNALRSSGPEHARYRAATTAALSGEDLHALNRQVEDIAGRLLGEISPLGHADLLAQYAFPLVFQTLNTLLGCPPQIGQRVAQGMAAIFEGIDAQHGNQILTAALDELITLKQRRPSDDVTSRLLAHEAGLDRIEMIHQLVTLYGAGIEPQTNLITNTVRLMLTDPRFSGDVLSGSLTAIDALDETLYTDPPMANYCLSYPPRPVEVEGQLLPAHQPVVISMAAASNDPSIADDDRARNRAHLAWSTGPHTCPARAAGYLIAQTAIQHLCDVLPDLRLAIPAHQLTWRPGPFHRALTALPVTFSPTRHAS
ncbi:cytochrome P450 [Streptomyces sp. CWNU-1]|uniref:Cytochrome P450 n=1 Tax=Streptomyces albipurpureus TaxID=2897419 RepID=A0ABT0UKP0_9ACTN|nr:cytochrome P450 [Streptomyces sp. CWNU-1]